MGRYFSSVKRVELEKGLSVIREKMVDLGYAISAGSQKVEIFEKNLDGHNFVGGSKIKNLKNAPSEELVDLSFPI